MTPEERTASGWREVFRVDRADVDASDKFRKGAHWGTLEQANAILNREVEAGRSPGRFRRAFVKVKKPFRTYDGGSWEKVILEAESKNADSIIYSNEGEKVGGESIIPLQETNVRLASTAGYIRDGDRYVFKGDAGQLPAEQPRTTRAEGAAALPPVTADEALGVVEPVPEWYKAMSPAERIKITHGTDAVQGERAIYIQDPETRRGITVQRYPAGNGMDKEMRRTWLARTGTVREKEPERPSAPPPSPQLAALQARVGKKKAEAVVETAKPAAVKVETAPEPVIEPDEPPVSRQVPTGPAITPESVALQSRLNSREERLRLKYGDAAFDTLAAEASDLDHEAWLDLTRMIVEAENIGEDAPDMSDSEAIAKTVQNYRDMQAEIEANYAARDDIFRAPDALTGPRAEAVVQKWAADNMPMGMTAALDEADISQDNPVLGTIEKDGETYNVYAVHSGVTVRSGSTRSGIGQRLAYLDFGTAKDGSTEAWLVEIDDPATVKWASPDAELIGKGEFDRVGETTQKPSKATALKAKVSAKPAGSVIPADIPSVEQAQAELTAADATFNTLRTAYMDADSAAQTYAKENDLLTTKRGRRGWGYSRTAAGAVKSSAPKAKVAEYTRLRKIASEAEAKMENHVREYVEPAKRDVNRANYAQVARDEKAPEVSRLMARAALLGSAYDKSGKTPHSEIDALHAQADTAAEPMARELYADATDVEVKALVAGIVRVADSEARDGNPLTIERLREVARLDSGLQLDGLRRSRIVKAVDAAGIHRVSSYSQGEILQYGDADLPEDFQKAYGSVNTDSAAEVDAFIASIPSAVKKAEAAQKAKEKAAEKEAAAKAAETAKFDAEARATADKGRAFAQNWKPPFQGATHPVEALGKVVNPSSTLPILRMVAVKDGTASATDLEATVQAQVDLPDGIYRRLPGSNILIIEQGAEGLEDFPYGFGKIEKPATTKLADGREFMQALKAAQAAAGWGSANAAIQAVWISKVNAGALAVSASDGRRLVSTTVAADASALPDGWAAGIGESSVAALLADPHGETLTIEAGQPEVKETGTTPGAVRFSNGNTTITARTTDVAKPDFASLLTGTTAETLTVDRKEFNKALAKLKKMAGKVREGVIVGITRDKGTLTLTTKDARGKTFAESIGVEVSVGRHTSGMVSVIMPRPEAGVAGDVFFMPYLADAAKAGTSAKVSFGMAGVKAQNGAAIRPVIFESAIEETPKAPDTTPTAATAWAPDVLKKNPAKADDMLRAGAPKTATIPILSRMLAKKGVGRTTDLENEVEAATDQADGLWEARGNAWVEAEEKADEFIPQMKLGASPLAFKFSADQSRALKAGLLAVQPAQSTDETRYVLNGVMLEIAKDGAVSIVGTDGRRLHVATAGTVKRTDGGDTVQMILRSSAVKLLLQSNGPGPITVKSGATEIDYTDDEGKKRKSKTAVAEITDGNITLRTKLIDGIFPSFRQVIPDTTNLSIRLRVNRKALGQALADVRPYVGGDPMFESATSVKLVISGKEIVVTTSANRPQYTMERTVPVEKKLAFAGEPLTIAFHPDYLADMVRAGDSETVEIGASDESSAFTVTNEDGTVKGVLMPLRLKAMGEASIKPPLVAMHNLSARNLAFAEEMGGLAMPSLGIGNAERPYEGFGEITLLGRPDLVDPKRDRSMRVANADQYSPRYPSATHMMAKGAVDAWKPVEAWVKKTYGDMNSESLKKEDYHIRSALYGLNGHLGASGDFRGRGIEDLYRDLALQAYFAGTRYGKAFKGTDEVDGREALRSFAAEHKAEFESWVNDTFGRFVERRIFKGFTNAGNKRYAPYTLDYVMKELRKAIRSKEGEGFFYGAGSVRAAIGSRQYRTLAQIQADRGNLRAGMDEDKQGANDRLVEIAEDGAAAYEHSRQFGYSETFWNAVIDAQRSRNPRAKLKEYGFDYDLMPWEKIRSFLDDLKAMPTEYFEAKPQRVVQLQEFTGAVVPSDATSTTLAILKRHGIEVEKYDTSKPDDRARAVRDLSFRQNVQFSSDLLPSQPRGLSLSDFTAAMEAEMGALPSASENTTPVLRYDDADAMVKAAVESGEGQAARGTVRTDDIAAVRKKYKGTPQWLMAPNGKPSKLNERQWLQVRTPSFKRWFGDWEKYATKKNGVWADSGSAVSKVVDENGEPQVVFHGTERAGFTSMNPHKADKHRTPMLFFTSHEGTARSYSGGAGEYVIEPLAAEVLDDYAQNEFGKPYSDLSKVQQSDVEANARAEQDTRERGVYPVFLNIRNPNEADFEGANRDGDMAGYHEVVNAEGEQQYSEDGRAFFAYSSDAQALADALREKDGGEYEVVNAGPRGETTNSVAEEGKKFGNDGAIIRETMDDGGRGGYAQLSDVFVAYKSEQIKSATQNVGTFNPATDDIRFSVGDTWTAPDGQRVRVIGASRNGQVRAVTIGNRSWFFLDRYDNASQLREDIREEAGHRLINKVFGPEWRTIAQQTYGGRWLSIVAEIKRNYRDRNGVPLQEGSTEFSHELFAKALRDGKQNVSLWRKFMDAVVAAFKRVMRKLGYYLGKLPIDAIKAWATKLQHLPISDAEIRAHLNRMLDAKARSMARGEATRVGSNSTQVNAARGPINEPSPEFAEYMQELERERLAKQRAIGTTQAVEGAAVKAKGSEQLERLKARMKEQAAKRAESKNVKVSERLAKIKADAAAKVEEQRQAKDAAVRATVATALNAEAAPKAAAAVSEGRMSIRRSIARLADAARKNGGTATRDELKRVKQEIVKAARENLPVSERGRLLLDVARAKNQADVERAVKKIDAAADALEKSELIESIRSVYDRSVDSMSVDVGYRQRIRALMDGFLFAKPTEATLTDARELAAYLESERASGSEADFSVNKDMAQLLRTLTGTPLREVGVPGLRDILGQIQRLAAIGRMYQKGKEAIEASRKADDLESVAGSSPIEDHQKIRPHEIGGKITLSASLKNRMGAVSDALRKWYVYHQPMDVVFDLLDGAKHYAGANSLLFKARIDNAFSAFRGEMHPFESEFADQVKLHKIGTAQSERIGVYAIDRQKTGRQKLLNTLSDGTPEDDIRVNAMIDAIKLTPDEQAFYEWMRGKLDAIRPAIERTMKDTYNAEIDRVEHYFPFITDWNLMEGSRDMYGLEMDDTGAWVKTKAGEGAMKKNVQQGFTKSRVGAGRQAVKINALRAFHKHMQDVNYYVHVGPTVKYLQEIATTPQYAAAAGKTGQRIVREYLDTMARQGGMGGSHILRWVDTLRNNIGVGMLGFRLSSTLIQPTSLLDGFGLIGGRWGLKGALNVTQKQWRDFMLDNMTEIHDRIGDDWAFGEAELRSKVARYGFLPLQALDEITAGAIASGAYEKNLHERGLAVDFSKPDAEALAYAQKMVRRTQASPSYKDQPLAISRGALFGGSRTLARAIYQFQTFTLNKFSFMMHDGLYSAIKNREPMAGLAILLWTLMAFVAEEAIRLGLRTIPAPWNDDDDDEDLTKFAGNVAMNYVQVIPWFGSAVSALRYDSFPAPVVDTIAEVGSGVKSMLTGKHPETRQRGAVRAAGAAGTMLGVPGTSQAAQWVRGSIRTDAQEKRSLIKDSIPRYEPFPVRINIEMLGAFKRADDAGLVAHRSEDGKLLSPKERKARFREAYVRQVEKLHGKPAADRYRAWRRSLGD